MRNDKRGFTLLEVLIAMSLFTILGLGVVLLMSTGVDMWVTGTTASYQEDQAAEGWPKLVQDFRHVLVPMPSDRIPFDPKDPNPQKLPPPLPPENRFISGYVMLDFGDRQVACRYICFVRDTTGFPEVEVYAPRAGRSPDADAYIDGKNDALEYKEKRHMPTGGKAEVMWIWLPKAFTQPATGESLKLGIGAVYRAYKSPIGGPGTLLDPKNFDTPAKLKKILTVEDPTKATKQTRIAAMIEDVTLFDAYFWTQYTTTWEWNSSEPRVTSRPKEPEQAKGGRPSCGPSRTWDSTRGILISNDALGFRLNKGESSLRFSGDDIWPRVVRIQLARAEQKTALATPMTASDDTFRVHATGFAMGQGELYGKFFKIGTEWVSVTARDGSQTDVFNILRRGRMGTSELAHPEETAVFFGRVQDHDIVIPAFRDDNN